MSRSRKLPDGWMKCRNCGSEFNHAVRDAEEAERARLLDLGGRVPELVKAERERVLDAVYDIVSDAFKPEHTNEPSIIIRAGLAKLQGSR